MIFTNDLPAQTTPSLEQYIRSKASPQMLHILNNPDSFRYQVIYTQIDRDKHNEPTFEHQYLNVSNNRYFYPASTVKLPTALMALEKINSLSNKGINKHTTMLTDSSYSKQERVWADSSSPSGKPSIAHYIKKIFIVSDNDAYNRLYEFNGQHYLNEALWNKGYMDTRISRRFVRMNEDENSHTNAIRFVHGDTLLYEQPPAFSHTPFDFSRHYELGNAHIDWSDSLIHQPLDFTRHNRFTLPDQQLMLQAVLFPASVPIDRRFDLTSDDYKMLYQYMSELPYESKYPKYDTTEFFRSYEKFFLWSPDSSKVPPVIRIWSKAGWSYGCLTDNAYIVDFDNRVEFMIAATIYVNANGVLNDDDYEYETIGLPFFKELGKIMHGYELDRKHRHKPKLDKWQQIAYD